MLSVVAIGLSLGPFILPVLMALGPSIIVAASENPRGRIIKRAIYGAMAALSLFLLASLYYLWLTGPYVGR